VSGTVYSPPNADLAPQDADLAGFPTWDPALDNPVTNPEIMAATDHVLPSVTAFGTPASRLYASAFTPAFPGGLAADAAGRVLDHPAPRL
jgi:hypothetical protein